MMALATGLEALNQLGGDRCHCPCHHGRAPRLLDHVESAWACDQCRLNHYEAEARERAGEFDPATGRAGPRRTVRGAEC